MAENDLVWEAVEPPDSEEDEELFPEDDRDPYDDSEWGQDEEDFWTEQRYLGDED